MTAWVQVQVPSMLLSQIPEIKGWQQKVTDGGVLSVFVGPEPGAGWHLSISHTVQFNGDVRPGRYPTWDEIKDARYRFCPDYVTMAMFLPPRAEYVNVHDTTFHLHEVPGD